MSSCKNESLDNTGGFSTNNNSPSNGSVPAPVRPRGVVRRRSTMPDHTNQLDVNQSVMRGPRVDRRLSMNQSHPYAHVASTSIGQAANVNAHPTQQYGTQGFGYPVTYPNTQQLSNYWPAPRQWNYNQQWNQQQSQQHLHQQQANLVQQPQHNMQQPQQQQQQTQQLQHIPQPQQHRPMQQNSMEQPAPQQWGFAHYSMPNTNPEVSNNPFNTTEQFCPSLDEIVPTFNPAASQPSSSRNQGAVPLVSNAANMPGPSRAQQHTWNGAAFAAYRNDGRFGVEEEHHDTYAGPASHETGMEDQPMEMGGADAAVDHASHAPIENLAAELARMDGVIREVQQREDSDATQRQTFKENCRNALTAARRMAPTTQNGTIQQEGDCQAGAAARAREPKFTFGKLADSWSFLEKAPASAPNIQAGANPSTQATSQLGVIPNTQMNAFDVGQGGTASMRPAHSFQPQGVRPWQMNGVQQQQLRQQNVVRTDFNSNIIGHGFNGEIAPVNTQQQLFVQQQAARQRLQEQRWIEQQAAQQLREQQQREEKLRQQRILAYQLQQMNQARQNEQRQQNGHPWQMPQQNMMFSQQQNVIPNAQQQFPQYFPNQNTFQNGGFFHPQQNFNN